MSPVKERERPKEHMERETPLLKSTVSYKPA
jgi:hypothetical protein